MIDRRLLENFDWLLLSLVSLISIMGIVTIYSTSLSYGSGSAFYLKQIIWFLIGLSILLGTTLIDFRVLGRFSLLLHFGIVLLLLLVLLYGSGGEGSPVRRWLFVGGIYFQPSEFTKFTLILYLSYHFRDSRKIKNLDWKGCLWPLFVTVIPAAFIILQPDLGTGILLFFILGTILFYAGISYKLIAISFLLFLSATPAIWFFTLKPYQKERVLTVLNPELDPLGKGYHIIQSKIALGSGGFLGKGFLQGSQTQLNFLPARHTDFIFAVFAEEWGFLGCIILLSIYCMLLFRCLVPVGQIKNRSGTILSVGVTSIIAAHTLINIGMVSGLLPIVGMPLPFFSYGGSSMLSMMFGIGMLMSVRARRFQYQSSF